MQPTACLECQHPGKCKAVAICRIEILHVDDTMKRQSQLVSSKTQAVGLFLLALAVRVAFVLTLEDRLYWPDEIDFDNVAVSLING